MVHYRIIMSNRSLDGKETSENDSKGSPTCCRSSRGCGRQRMPQKCITTQRRRTAVRNSVLFVRGVWTCHYPY